MTEDPKQKQEHILHVLYYLQDEHGEAGVPADHPQLVRHNGGSIEALAAAGLLEVSGGMVNLSPDGHRQAGDVVRRHRLAERLMMDVLGMPPASGEYIAGEMEHIVSPELTRGICTLLGHPTECPHGNPIPPGPCCREGQRAVGAAVISLHDLPPGEEATVSYITYGQPLQPGAQCPAGPGRGGPHRHRGPGPHGPQGPEDTGARRIAQLGSLGVFPGEKVTVLQKSPAYVLRVRGTTLALDDELARSIRVRRSEPPTA
jgi:DtxR family Mn-dependent transcriptional regulator